MPRKKTTEENVTTTPEELKPKRRIGRPKKVKEEPKVEPAEEPKKLEKDPKRYAKDKRVVDLHTVYTASTVDRMVEDGETVCK